MAMHTAEIFPCQKEKLCRANCITASSYRSVAGGQNLWSITRDPTLWGGIPPARPLAYSGLLLAETERRALAFQSPELERSPGVP